MKLLRPRHFDAFHCIGAACEDTCCAGWTVLVDKATFEKYQRASDPALHSLVTINPKSANDDDFSSIELNGLACPALSEGLCSIQHRFGEDYLSNMCATYPRVVNRAGDQLQLSLDLSCPEAARLVLLDPRPMEFVRRSH